MENPTMKLMGHLVNVRVPFRHEEMRKQEVLLRQAEQTRRQEVSDTNERTHDVIFFKVSLEH